MTLKTVMKWEHIHDIDAGVVVFSINQIHSPQTCCKLHEDATRWKIKLRDDKHENP